MSTILPHTRNPVLHDIAAVVPVDSITGQSIQTMIHTMQNLLKHEDHGVALAAPQIGKSIQLFVIAESVFIDKETKEVDTKTPRVYINPIITKYSRKKRDMHEGCLSVRGWWGYVSRSEKVTIAAYDEYGNYFTRGASGLLAHIYQHEVDHLQGILYTDKAISMELAKDE